MMPKFLTSQIYSFVIGIITTVLIRDGFFLFPVLILIISAIILCYLTVRAYHDNIESKKKEQEFIKEIEALREGNST